MIKKLSDKDKKDWESFVKSNEKIYNKDSSEQKKLNKKILKKTIDLHGYSLENANKTISEYINTIMNDSTDSDEECESAVYPQPSALRISTLTGTCQITSDINLLVLSQYLQLSKHITYINYGDIAVSPFSKEVVYTLFIVALIKSISYMMYIIMGLSKDFISSNIS